MSTAEHYRRLQNAAKRQSQKDGRLRFVFATGLGYRLSTKRIKFQDCWWTNGQCAGVWKAYATTGDIANALTEVNCGNPA